MIFKRAYRLGEYRIVEDEPGLLRWETHFNFGIQRSGKGYIFGNVLILGNWSHEESGYLQLEFSELLQKLPIWDRTHYYCFAAGLLDAWSRSLVLSHCHVEAHQTDNTGLINLHQYKMEEHSVNEKPSAPNWPYWNKEHRHRHNH